MIYAILLVDWLLSEPLIWQLNARRTLVIYFDLSVKQYFHSISIMAQASGCTFGLHNVR
jgi:hypothetical protein